MWSQLPAAVEEEIVGALGNCTVVPFSHPGQRNRTFLIRAGNLEAVAKLYVDRSIDELRDIGRAEALVRDAGVVVPELLFQSSTIPLVIHELLPGVHRQPLTMEDIQHCADWFQVQHDALRAIGPVKSTKRPATPPKRARLAGDQARDPTVRALIWTMWRRLSALAEQSAQGVSHTDWRTDNFLYHRGRLSAVLDWESIVLLPAAEAAGYAAASFTHSWRDNLYRPFEVEPASRFLRVLRLRTPWLDTGTSGVQLRIATAFTAAVRLGEDQARGIAASTIAEILTILEEANLP